MAAMEVKDAMRVADIFEADDVISAPAMACRILVRYVRELEEKTYPQPDIMFQTVALAVEDKHIGTMILSLACEYGYLTDAQKDLAIGQL